MSTLSRLYKINGHSSYKYPETLTTLRFLLSLTPGNLLGVQRSNPLTHHHFVDWVVDLLPLHCNSRNRVKQVHGRIYFDSDELVIENRR